MANREDDNDNDRPGTPERGRQAPVMRDQRRWRASAGPSGASYVLPAAAHGWRSWCRYRFNSASGKWNKAAAKEARQVLLGPARAVRFPAHQGLSGTPYGCRIAAACRITVRRNL